MCRLEGSTGKIIGYALNRLWAPSATAELLRPSAAVEVTAADVVYEVTTARASVA